MNLLIFTIGTPGAGKSTWIKNNGLELNTISPDNLRFLFGSIETDITGSDHMTLKNDNKVWRLLFELVEKRMRDGDLIIIDATHSSNKMISAYKALTDKYRYRAIAIDFRNIPLDQILKQNLSRRIEKQVPESEIKRIYERVRTIEIPGWVTVLDHDTTIKDIEKRYNSVYQYSENINQVNIFGDIHGCLTEFDSLKNKSEVKFNDENTINMFVGDYFDRFYQKDELIKLFEFLDSLDVSKNILLTGNHENYFYLLKEYEKLKNDLEIKKTIKNQKEKINDLEEEIFYLESQEENKENEENEEKLKRLKKKLEKLQKKLDKNFEKFRKVEEEYQNVIRKNIPKGTRITLHNLTEEFGHKRVRNFFRKLKIMTRFKFGENEYFINHGGFPRIPTIFDKTIQIIKGVGKYGDEEEVIKNWAKNTKNNQFQIFGHRDIFGIKDDLFDEYRGCIINGDADSNPDGTLKCLIIKKENNEIKHLFLEEKTTRKIDKVSDYYQNKIEKLLDEDIKYLQEKGIIEVAKRHKFIEVKVVKENDSYEIFAINFTNKAFKKGIWDVLSIHSRGLFVLRIKETGEETIISRGYHKFFNLNERDETRLKNLRNINYPLNAFEKANGYLGLLSVYQDPISKKLNWFISSKTTIDSDYAKVFQEMIKPYLNEKVKEFLFKNNVTAAFEVIEPTFDPHIQEYKEKELVFLNLIEKDIDFKLKLDIEKEFLALFNKPNIIRPAKLLKVINDYKELVDFINELDSQKLLTENFIEGVVIRENGDSPFMFKLKTKWYKFWKGNRSTKDLMYRKIQKPFLNQDEINLDLLIKRELPSFKNYGGYEYQLFVNFLLEKIKNNEVINKNIIDLRKEFLSKIDS